MVQLKITATNKMETVCIQKVLQIRDDTDTVPPVEPQDPSSRIYPTWGVD